MFIKERDTPTLIKRRDTHMLKKSEPQVTHVQKGESDTHVQKGEREVTTRDTKVHKGERETTRSSKPLPVTDLLDLLPDELSPVGYQKHHTLGWLALGINPTGGG